MSAATHGINKNKALGNIFEEMGKSSKSRLCVDKE